MIAYSKYFSRVSIPHLPLTPPSVRLYDLFLILSCVCVAETTHFSVEAPYRFNCRESSHRPVCLACLTPSQRAEMCIKAPASSACLCCPRISLSLSMGYLYIRLCNFVFLLSILSVCPREPSAQQPQQQHEQQEQSLLRFCVTLFFPAPSATTTPPPFPFPYFSYPSNPTLC